MVVHSPDLKLMRMIKDDTESRNNLYENYKILKSYHVAILQYANSVIETIIHDNPLATFFQPVEIALNNKQI